MITKKEDLIGRYALRSEKEVFELFMQKCEGFGLSWATGHRPRDLPSGQAVTYNSDRDGLTQEGKAFFEKEGYKKLTLSDLKEKEEMKIDYELAEKIGATHYYSQGDEQVTYYKLTDSELFCFSECCGEYVGVLDDAFWCMKNLKPIPKPRTRTEYEKVSFVGVGDCVQSVHDNYGEYFFLNNRSGEYQAAEYQDSAWYWKEDNLYRKVEKPVDWRESVFNFVNGELSCHEADVPHFDVADRIIIDGRFEESDFIEMCRVTLRALGEIE